MAVRREFAVHTGLAARETAHLHRRGYSVTMDVSSILRVREAVPHLDTRHVTRSVIDDEAGVFSFCHDPKPISCSASATLRGTHGL